METSSKVIAKLQKGIFWQVAVSICIKITTASITVKDNDNGRRATTELSWTLKGFSTTKRIAFIDALTRNRNLSYTFELIPIYGNQRQKFGLRIKLLNKILLAKKNYNSTDLVKAIIKTYQPIDYLLLRCFFYVNTDFDSNIMKALYELDKEFFLLEFKNILRKTPKNHWLNLRGLFNNTDARDFLKSNLTKTEFEKLEAFEIRDNQRLSYK